MTRWVTSPKPKADLTPAPQTPGVDQNGTRYEYFTTKFGVRFVRITEPSGFTYWRKEVP